MNNPPCSWFGFNGFWFISNPNQDNYDGPVRAGFGRVCKGLINMLGWFGQLVSPAAVRFTRRARPRTRETTAHRQACNALKLLMNMDNLQLAIGTSNMATPLPWNEQVMV